ncbi:S49 family peptidase [Salmonirosea aquatica]|uniref:Peptidase S49 domain-containing protein n=1 Tax=Salmonirosea aquatica TaxID=2654236 RepID=A0A7C9BLF5_9BACT|nr:hypothetical protein [Cytophagaceae bacterium SJW1-29]
MNAETFSGLWFIDEPFAHRMEGIILPRLAAGFDPIPPHFLRANEQLRAGISFRDSQGNFSYSRYLLDKYLTAGGGDVAVIPINGTMSRYGFCGGGNEEIASVLAEAATEKQVKGVVLKMDTPGGTVDSTDMLADAVASFPKRIEAWTNYCASAGMFVASQADDITMENGIVSSVGSIGVLMVYVDRSEQLEKSGQKVTIFRADGSQDKARINGVEPLTDELRAEITAQLNEAKASFDGYVRRGRAGKMISDEPLTGKMYNKRDALRLGLVDRLGSLADTINRVRSWA